MSNNTQATVFNVFDGDLLEDRVFMYGWRKWSFDMTRKGDAAARLQCGDKDLGQKLKKIGKTEMGKEKAEWNLFRSKFLNLFPSLFSSKLYQEQYRQNFKHIGLVVIDCCFIVKYRYDMQALYDLIRDMFRATGTDEVPTYFVLLDNDITEAELNHKTHQQGRAKYVNTQEGIQEHDLISPTLAKDKMMRLSVPFGMTHTAMTFAETSLRKQGTSSTLIRTRANTNDYALLFLMHKIRQSFNLCARVLILTDDKHLTKISNTFIPRHKPNVSIYKNLPREYTEPYIITSSVLSEKYWRRWRADHIRYHFRKRY